MTVPCQIIRSSKNKTCMIKHYVYCKNEINHHIKTWNFYKITYKFYWPDNFGLALCLWWAPPVPRSGRRWSWYRWLRLTTPTAGRPTASLCTASRTKSSWPSILPPALSSRWRRQPPSQPVVQSGALPPALHSSSSGWLVLAASASQSGGVNVTIYVRALVFDWMFHPRIKVIALLFLAMSLPVATIRRSLYLSHITATQQWQ